MDENSTWPIMLLGGVFLVLFLVSLARDKKKAKQKGK